MPIRNIGDAIREAKAGSKHIKTRKQAIAVGLKAAGKSKKKLKRRKRKHQVRDTYSDSDYA